MNGTTTKNFDAIIIGAGQAGPALAVKLANAGMNVALIERKLFGGTCVNTGCIPTKTLIASARVAYLANHTTEFGINISGSVNVAMPKVKARKDTLVLRYRSGVEKWLRETPRCTVYQNHARFIDSTTISVGDELLKANQFFINVGARASAPAMPGLEKIKYFTNSTIMDIDFAPEHLIIIGGSYIGLEFAQMYRRFGSKVTVIEKADRLVPKEDPDVSEEIKNILQREEIAFKLNTECIAFKTDGKNIIVETNCKDPKTTVSGSHVLLAIGRKPNTDDLGLDKAGVAVDERGFVKVDDQLRTNVNHIWALGECNGKGAFTHTSYNDYEIVAANLLDQIPRRVSDRILTYALFIDPPLGRAGMTEADAIKSGKEILVAKRPMSQVKRAVIKGDDQGFIKIIVDKQSKQILGAAILGMEGDEVIQSILDVMYAKAPYTTIKNAVHIHPTVTELLPTTLNDLKTPDKSKKSVSV